ncbi:MAG: patatin-like phospholipase family protein [Actinomycetota bacterium]|nr:patatin-like phospholipase family protein [Actinomycetota bacterium]
MAIPLEDEHAGAWRMPDPAWRNPVRVLSIDGGGIRGVIPAMVLAELEARTGKATSSLFDLIAGTSIGGIIALGLVAPGPDGAPVWSARELIAMFERASNEIFVPTGHSVLHGVLHHRYASEYIEATLIRYLGSNKISDALCDVLLTAYDLSAREPYFITSMAAKSDREHDLPMWMAGRATSAAPTYFEPARFHPASEKLLLDGGVYANNPAMCAFAEVVKYRRNFDMQMVSLGTGSSKRAMAHQEVSDWGLAQWARPILHVLMDGASHVVHRQLREMLPADAYWRLQVDLAHASESIDDATPQNLADLMAAGERLVKSTDRELDEICATLTA